MQIITNIVDFGMNIQAAGDVLAGGTGSTEPTASNGSSLTDGGYITFESEVPCKSNGT